MTELEQDADSRLLEAIETWWHSQEHDSLEATNDELLFGVMCLLLQFAESKKLPAAALVSAGSKALISRAIQATRSDAVRSGHG